MPWYATLFGRDSLICATQMLAFDPPMAEQTLRVLARLVARADDPRHDEEPGKVLHELRTGEVARLGLTPLARYYGTVDATPLFLCLLSEHADWSGNLSLFEELRDAVEAMLGWIDGPGDRDGDGLLEYRQRRAGGLRNQGWKDSDEGVLDEHGTPLEPPSRWSSRRGTRCGQAAARAPVRARRRARARRGAAGARPPRCARGWSASGCPSAATTRWASARDGRPSAALASNQGHLLCGRPRSRPSARRRARLR